MNNSFSYNGVVTLVQRVDGKEVSKTYHNNGTEQLFELFARAMVGQTVTEMSPTHIDVLIKDDKTNKFNSVLKNKISIITSYKNKDSDGGLYGVPYCRISLVLLKNMFNTELFKRDDSLTLELKSSYNDDVITLAYVNVNGMAKTILDMSPAIQLILLWDLYITNPQNESTKGEDE